MNVNIKQLGHSTIFFSHRDHVIKSKYLFFFLLSKETKVGAFLLSFLCIAEHREAFLTSSYRSVPAKVTIRVSTLRQESDIPSIVGPETTFGITK